MITVQEVTKIAFDHTLILLSNGAFFTLHRGSVIPSIGDEWPQAKRKAKAEKETWK